MRVRNMIDDIQSAISRKASSGPFFNDDFGDVYGNVYAFTADGLTRAPAARLCRIRRAESADGAERRQGQI